MNKNTGKIDKQKPLNLSSFQITQKVALSSQQINYKDQLFPMRQLNKQQKNEEYNNCLETSIILKSTDIPYLPQQSQIEIHRSLKRQTQNVNKKFHKNAYFASQSLTSEVFRTVGNIYKVSQTMLISVYEDENQKKYNQDINSVIKIQSNFRRLIQQRVFSTLVKQHRYRMAIIKELLSTEKNYVNSLDIMVKQIRQPLLQNNVISKDECIKLFSNVNEIKKLNEQYLLALVMRFKNFEPASQIGDIFITYAMFFKIYFEYISNYNTACNLLIQLKKKNLSFKLFLQSRSNSEQWCFMDLESMLVKPVQRLPKYNLLLQDLIKHTNKDHPDFGNLKQAYELFELVCNENNSKLDRQIINSRMFDLQKMYGESNNINILEAHREFIEEILLTLYWKNNGKSVIVYILSDMIILTECRPKISQQTFLGLVNLNHHSQCKQIPNTIQFQNLFTVQGQNDQVTFIADTFKQRDHCLMQINSLIQKLKDKFYLRQDTLNKSIMKNNKLSANQDLKPSPMISKINQKQEITVLSHCSIQKIILKVDKKTQISELYSMMQEKLILKTVFDFKFVLHKDGKRIILDDRQEIVGLMEKPFFFNFFNYSELWFKKVLFLGPQKDQNLYCQDQNRLDSIFNQLKQELIRGDYILTLKQYALILSLFIFIDGLGLDKNILNKQLKIIPSEILIKSQKDFWQKVIPETYSNLAASLSQEIKCIGMHPIVLAKIVFINTLSTAPLYGQQLFNVQLGRNNLQQGLQELMILGISKDKLQLYARSNKKLLQTYQYFDLQLIKYDSNKISIKTQTNNLETILISDETSQIYLIFQLYYKNFQDYQKQELLK